jgi:chemotaxis protein histidine kinase CheA
MAAEQTREEKLASMARRFVDRARGQAARIGELRPAVQRDQGKGEALAELRQLTHSLHGSAGTFGFGDISVAAGIAEELCDTLMAAQDKPAPQLLSDFDRALEALLAQISRIE